MTHARGLCRIGIVVALGAVLGCSGGSGSPQATATPARGVAGVDRAIEGINATRDPLVVAMNAVVVAANRIDAIDAISVKGDWQKAKSVREKNPVDPAAVMDIVTGLPAQVRAYSAALNALSKAANARGVPVRPAEAVRQIVAVGRAESAAVDAFARAVVTAWPAYAVLAGLQSLWYERATSGWYDTKKLALQEYAVLTDRNRTTTSRASRLFATNDPPRREAADTWAQTLEQIEPILHPKRG